MSIHSLNLKVSLNFTENKPINTIRTVSIESDLGIQELLMGVFNKCKLIRGKLFFIGTIKLIIFFFQKKRHL